MHRGYVKDYRKSLDHPLYKKPLVWHFWNYCLLRARKFPDTMDFNGKPLLIEKGCFVMSLNRAAKKTGLSEQNIKTAIKNLENHKMIEKSTEILTKQATLIRVLNFEFYQSYEYETNEETNEGLTKSQRSPNEVLTINKKDKEGLKKVKKQPSQKVYSKEFEKLWIDYPKSGDAKQRTFTNYKQTKEKLNFTDQQVYDSCIGYADYYKSTGKSIEYIYILTNLVGTKYREILPKYLNYVPPDDSDSDFDITDAQIDAML